MTDPTENIRQSLTEAVNEVPMERADLEHHHGQVWDTQQLGTDFDVLGYMAPFVVVKRRSDGVKGSLLFQHRPRYYFSFHKD